MSQDNQVKKEKIESFTDINQQRRRFSRLVTVSPVLMSLVSKSALGRTPYNCSVSGAQSGNTSNPHETNYACGVGFSPGGWWQNASKSNNQDGNVHHWLSAEVIPFDIRKSSSGEKQIFQDGKWVKNSSVYSAIKDKYGKNAQATLFSSIFGGTSPDSLWQVLNDNRGGVIFHAIADYLNASLANSGYTPFSPVYDNIEPADIVGLYQVSVGDISSYTTSSRVVIDSAFPFESYLSSIHN